MGSFTILLCALSCLQQVAAGQPDHRPAATDRPHCGELRCEYLVNPLGIGMTDPRLSWVISSNARGVQQHAYQVLAATSKEKLTEQKADLWNTGKASGDRSIHVVYAGKPLHSGEVCYWTVRVWTLPGAASAWSAPAFFSVGLLDGSDWKGAWIGAPPEKPSALHDPPIPPSPLLRKSFTVTGKVRRATVYVTSLGDYELRLNGARVGNHLLAPEWTDFRKRVQYQTFDVTSLVRKGANAVGAVLADGWYAGRIGPTRWDTAYPRRGPYGLDRRLRLQMEIESAGGSRQVIASDSTWRMYQDGPIRMADNFLGETYDARREVPGWDSPGFDARTWRRVTEDRSIGVHTDAQMNEPIARISQVEPLNVSQPKPGVFIFDLGQNMVGWCRVGLEGKAGSTVTLRHGEMLNSDGTLYMENLAAAVQTDRYILDGKGKRAYEPHFTYHGFRYVEVTGLSGTPRPDLLTGIVISSSAPTAGTIVTSDSLYNRIVSNTLWSQRGNMVGIPTDCPQRDERMGWMGDAQVFSQTSIFNLEMAPFYTKWIRDIRDAQASDGKYPDFAPHPYNPEKAFTNAPGWADAGVIVPWRLYQNYADTRILEQHYGSMVRFIEHIRATNPDLIWKNDTGNRYGDWLNGSTIIAAGYPKEGANMPHDAYATAFFAHSTEILAKAARVLGRAGDAEKYGRLASDIKAVFVRTFVHDSCRIEGDTQAGYALALSFDLLPEPMRREAAERMVEGLARYDGRMSTGFQSTVRMMVELSRRGFHNVACGLASSHRLPSWGYSIDQGATTIWERWDGYVAGRGFQDAGMNSFNHYSFGSVVEWMYRTLLGLNFDEEKPGYRHFYIRPMPGGSLTWVRGEYRSMYGPIGINWKLERGLMILTVRVPANAEATVYVPTTDASRVVESGKPVVPLRSEVEAAVFHLGSGTYEFEAPWVR